MEKAAAYTLESVKKAAYGIDESGRVHIGNALRTGQSPWRTIVDVQQRFNLNVDGCNGAIQFLQSMDSTNCSINASLVDALISQLDAMVERLDQHSRLELLKQTIRLIEVKELQCVSISIMKRLDTIPEKYLKRLIAKGLISEFPTVVRRQGWRLDNSYFIRSIEEVLLENNHTDKSELPARSSIATADTQQLELHVTRLVGMIETTKELFDNFAEYCTQQSLLSKRGARPPTPAQSSSATTASNATAQGLLTNTDSQDVATNKPDVQSAADRQRIIAYNFANLLRRVLVTLQEKGQKIQSAEKLHDFAMVLDRCKRQKAVEPTAIVAILQHFAEMIRGREAAEAKVFKQLEDIYLESLPAKGYREPKPPKLAAAPKPPKVKDPKAPAAPRSSKRKAIAVESDSEDSAGLSDDSSGAGAGAGARKASSKKKGPGRQAARKKSRVVESDGSFSDGADSDVGDSEPVMSQETLERYIQEGLDILRSLDVHGDFNIEVSDDVCAGYSKKVSRAMDIVKMQRKLLAHEYQSLKDVDCDVALMVRNCQAFHGKQSEYTKVGLQLQRKWKKCCEDFRERSTHDDADEMVVKIAKAPTKKRIVVHKPTAAVATVFTTPSSAHGPSTVQLIADVPHVVLSPAAMKHIHALEEIPRATKIPTEELVKAVLDIAWNFLKAVDSAGTFVKRVSDKEAPGYSSVVTTPMELTTMKRKVMRGDYSSIDEFHEDVMLIYSNCVTYNSRSKRFIEMAVQFKQAWDQFREQALQKYPKVTSASQTSSRFEIPAMDRGYYVNDDPDEEDDVIQLPYILTPQQIRQAVAAERADVHAGPGLRVIMNLVLDYMEMLDDQGQFTSPVLIPDYLKTITNPMDFGTMRVKVDRKKYKTVEEFGSDLMLVFQNCFQFNGLKDEIFFYAEQMQFGWYLTLQNIQSVLKDDPSLAVELKPPHLEGGSKVDPAREAVTATVSAEASTAPSVVTAVVPTAPEKEAVLPASVNITTSAPKAASSHQSFAGRHRADRSLIKLPFILTRQKFMSRLKSKDIKAASTLREIMQYVWGYFTALDSQGYFAGPVTTAEYLEKVSEPMDLGTIKVKVDRKKCKSLEDFEADLALLTSNCFAFYDVNSPQYKYAERIQYAWRLIKLNIQSVLTENAFLAKELPADHVEDKDAFDDSSQPTEPVPPAPVPAAVHSESQSQSQSTSPPNRESPAAQHSPEQTNDTVDPSPQDKEVKVESGAMDVIAAAYIDSSVPADCAASRHPQEDRQEEAVIVGPTSERAPSEQSEQAPAATTSTEVNDESCNEHHPLTADHEAGKTEVVSGEGDSLMNTVETQAAVAQESTVEAAQKPATTDAEVTAVPAHHLETDTQMAMEVAEATESASVDVANEVGVAAVDSSTMEVEAEAEVNKSMAEPDSQFQASPAPVFEDPAAGGDSETTSVVSTAQPAIASHTPAKDSSSGVGPPPISGLVKPVPSPLLRWLTSAKHRLQNPLRLVCGKVVEFAEGINAGDGIVLQDLPPVMADYHVRWALTMLRDTALQQLFRKQLAMRLRELIVASSDTSAVTATSSVKTDDGCFAHRVSFPHADLQSRSLFQLCQMSLTYEHRIEPLDDHVLRVYLPLLVYYTVRPDESIPVPAAGDSKASNATAKAVVKKVLEHADPLTVMTNRREKLKSCYSERVVLREFLESIGTHLVNMKLKG